MENVWYIVIVGLLIIAIFAWFRSRQLPADFPYQSQGRLLSDPEVKFHQALLETLQKHGDTEDMIVFAKVRIADVISPGKAVSGSEWQDAYERISSKHFDYVICSAADSQIRLIIESSEPNQRSVKRLRRDHFLDQVCASASLPLLRLPMQDSYDQDALWSQIASKVLSSTDSLTETEVDAEATLQQQVSQGV